MPPPKPPSQVSATAAAKLQQAQQLIGTGKAVEALSMLRTLSVRESQSVHVASLHGLAAMRAGLHDEAEYQARRALAIAPGEAALKSNLAMTLLQRQGAAGGARIEAMALLRDTLAEVPHHMDALCTLALLLLDENKPGELLTLCEAAVEHCRTNGLPEPADPQFAMYFSQVLAIAGRYDEGRAVLDSALARFPGHPGLRLAAALPLHVTPGVGAREVAEKHAAYGRALCAVTQRVHVHTPTAAERDRPLRVGVMSPDLRRHSVAFFTLPWLAQIDKGQFNVYGYFIGHREDEVSARLRQHMAGWHALGHATDGEIIERIRKDKVDILIELAGLTSEQRFSVLAAKPAPVLGTYCGYPDTTGIPTVDFRIVDSHTDPVALPAGARAGTPTFDERCVERLVRIDPCFLCYEAPSGAPGVDPCPAAANGHVTFASFNAWRKLNPRIVRLWARAVGAVPGSRLLIKCADMRDDFARGRVRAMVDAEPALRGRCEVLEVSPTIQEHLALYARVDIALDTYPYHGTTTTCEAALMGVPTVTLEGDLHVSRVGVSLLRNIGVPEFIARDEDEFVRIAAGLATDGARREELRGLLRGKLLASPLCDAEGFTRRFEGALRAVWHAACG